MGIVLVLAGCFTVLGLGLLGLIAGWLDLSSTIQPVGSLLAIVGRMDALLFSAGLSGVAMSGVWLTFHRRTAARAGDGAIAAMDSAVEVPPDALTGLAELSGEPATPQSSPQQRLRSAPASPGSSWTQA